MYVSHSIWTGQTFRRRRASTKEEEKNGHSFLSRREGINNEELVEEVRGQKRFSMDPRSSFIGRRQGSIYDLLLRAIFVFENEVSKVDLSSQKRLDNIFPLALVVHTILHCPVWVSATLFLQKRLSLPLPLLFNFPCLSS